MTLPKKKPRKPANQLSGREASVLAFVSRFPDSKAADELLTSVSPMCRKIGLNIQGKIRSKGPTWKAAKACMDWAEHGEREARKTALIRLEEARERIRCFTFSSFNDKKATVKILEQLDRLIKKVEGKPDKRAGIASKAN